MEAESQNLRFVGSSHERCSNQTGRLSAWFLMPGGLYRCFSLHSGVNATRFCALNRETMSVFRSLLPIGYFHNKEGMAGEPPARNRITAKSLGKRMTFTPVLSDSYVKTVHLCCHYLSRMRQPLSLAVFYTTTYIESRSGSGY